MDFVGNDADCKGRDNMSDTLKHGWQGYRRCIETNDEIAELKALVSLLEWDLEKANESKKRLRRVAMRYMRLHSDLLMESRMDREDAEKVLKETVGRMVGRRLVGRLNKGEIK